MEKKLPKIYKGEDYRHVSNNKKIFSFDGKSKSLENKRDISFEKDYIINMPVKIETFDNIITAKIVSKVGDHIMTSTNQIIMLKDIKSITKI